MSSAAVQPLLALLACPVGGNPTQYMIEKAVAHHDLDWRYLTFEVGPDELGDAVRGLRALGFRGAHCAAPHKQAVVPLLDRTTDTAAHDRRGQSHFPRRERPGRRKHRRQGRRSGNPRACSIRLESTSCCSAQGKSPGPWRSSWPRPAWPSLTIVNRTESRAAELAALAVRQVRHARFDRLLV